MTETAKGVIPNLFRNLNVRLLIALALATVSYLLSAYFDGDPIPFLDL